MDQMIAPQQQATANLERDFLLCCLQGRFHSGSLEEAYTISAKEGFDWNVLEELVEKERLAPLLFSIIRDRQLVSIKFEAHLKESYMQNALQNALQFRNLSRLIKMFADEGVEIIVLKGAALAETIYENIAVRPMVDMDILVKKENVSHVIAKLDTDGYIPSDPEAHPGMITEYENEILMLKNGRINVALEVHWSLLDSPYYQQKMDMNWFWQTAETAQIGESEGLVLCKEALLLHLCSHIMLHHQGEGILWQHDIAEVLVKYTGEFNWDILLEKAKAYDLVLSMQHVLNRINELWKIQLPDEVMAKIIRLQPSNRELQLFEWLTAPKRPVGKRFLMDLTTSSGWNRRIGYAWRSMFPSRDYMKKRYEIKRSYLLPLYYPYRWLLGIRSLFWK